jgi:hypothetical protein
MNHGSKIAIFFVPLFSAWVPTINLNVDESKLFFSDLSLLGGVKKKKSETPLTINCAEPV